MKRLIIITILITVCNACLYCQTIDDIKRKLGAKSNNESDKNQSIKTKGFRQLGGRYCIVEVRDISAEEAEQILKHMNRLIEEFLKLYEFMQKLFLALTIAPLVQYTPYGRISGNSA